MFKTFLNAWKIAVSLYHNKQMEYCNNPTPEVVYSMHERGRRCLKLKHWGTARWGNKKIEDALLKTE